MAHFKADVPYPDDGVDVIVVTHSQDALATEGLALLSGPEVKRST